MNKPVGNTKAIYSILNFTTLLIFSACSHVGPVNKNANHLQAVLLPPVSFLLDTMPAPKVVELKNVPRPQIIQVPKTASGFYYRYTSDTSREKIKLEPPHTVKAQLPFANFTNFNKENSLPSNTIFCGFLDKKGRLWFSGTNESILCYDGMAFTSYKLGNGGSTVTCIIQDRLGNLWIATRGDGVFEFDGIKFKVYTINEGLSNNLVYSILEDKNGNIWFGTEGGVSRYDGQRFHTMTIKDGLAYNVVYGMAEDQKGNIWFATMGGGASRYDGEGFTTFTTEQGLADNYVLRVKMDKTGNLWFATWKNGVSSFDGYKFTNFNRKDGLASDNVNDIVEDQSGNLWFGSIGGGVSRFDGKTFETFSTEQGLADNNILSITEDRNRALWLGTLGGGISRYNDSKFVTYTNKQGLPGDNIYDIKQDKKGNLWFATANNGVILYDGSNFTGFSLSQGLAQKTVWCVEEDKDGNLWFGTSAGGVSRFDGRSFTNYTSKQGLAGDQIACIQRDSHGDLWFGTNGAGISRFDGSTFTTFTTAQGLPSNLINCISQGVDNKIWFGTDAGASSYDGHRFTNFTVRQGLAHNYVNSIIADRSGKVWFGTNHGTSRYDGHGFISFTTKEGLLNDVIDDIAEDKDGVIWLGTDEGLCNLKFNMPGNQYGDARPAGLMKETNLQLKTFSPVWKTYNNKTGYPIHATNLSAMCITRRGLPFGNRNDSNIIWSGSTEEKLIRFDPKPAYKNTDVVNAFVRSVRIDENVNWYILNKKYEDSALIEQQDMQLYGNAQSEPERDSLRKKFKGVQFDSIAPYYQVPANLVLPYKFNRISFDYGAVETDRSSMIRYQYFLDGYDKDWNSITERTSVSYANLPEGDYIFKLKARNPDGMWGVTIEYQFKVLPPWYRTWWAYTLFILGFIAALWTFIRLRVRTLRKEKLVLEKRVASRTYELQQQKEKVESTLTELKSTQAQLVQSAKMASLGELTAGIAHEIQNPLNFVNNFSEVSNELIEELNAERVKPKAERDESLEDEIINDIKQNLEKINHHGKRAGAIVKGMLQHSRSSIGVKEPTDINALADEYLRLSYHGFRTKDKEFNAELKTDFDNSIGKINIIPQDIGRVLLNLYNNAFYAVAEKKKTADSDYEPTISVSTKKSGDQVSISVSDNGNGIPQKAIDKIFQPFFTTKPTGQGTGLGLSMSYDIVKAHGGEINVETKEEEGTEFIIHLPIV